MSVIEFCEVFARSYVLKILGKLEKFSVVLSVQVRLTKCLYAQSVVRIHEEVSSNVVEHDCVLRSVLWVFAPNDT